MKVDNSKIFEYETDWFQYFEQFLNQKKIEDEDKNAIKVNIVESNQSIQDLELRFKNEIEVIPGKESFFYNVVLRSPDENHYLYVNTQSENARFWTIHNKELQEKILPKIDEIFNNSYLQDSIYLSNQMMDYYRNNIVDYSLGLSLKFEDLSENIVLDNQSNQNLLANSGISLRCWTKNKRSVSNIINGFKKIRLPINYSYLNCVFEDEDEEISVKENLFFDGKITIERGNRLARHMDFVRTIRRNYEKQLSIIEELRPNWREFKGELYEIKFENNINHKSFIDQLINNFSTYKVYTFFMYKEADFYEYLCIDAHTGGKFYLTIYPERISINLNNKSCGNIVLRLLSNLQRHFDPNLDLYANEENLAAVAK